ncbi:apolipoprotein N-acyltransferase [Marinobacter nanhaiticus D15-8W]|uniref:apolipoprotein N-acyltransferase n=1 Tax=Marinobacter nanhaiticus TaxID=1305740 RepID=UPI0002C8E6C5|nr:apolipoprotein N-acyltransferase [Marinobacter nanhaiticus]BES72377.1 apolipoprotein N-acyltransferase [Marinobacter nanhaiticus D15-8W]
MSQGRLLATDSLLAASAGVLLALPYNHSELFLLSWAGFVPLLFALRGKRLAEAYLLGLICGLALYGVGAWWIVGFIGQLWAPGPFVTFLLSALFWLYSAQLPAFLALVFQWLRRRTGWSDLLLFPMLVALFFGHFPMLFHAQLGESQSLFLTALQAVSLTGVLGLDALIALVNVLLFRWLAGQVPAQRDRIGWAAAVLPLAWLAYGLVSLGLWDARLAEWPTRRVGFVQENVPAGVDQRPPAAGYSSSYPRALALSEQLADAGAGLVVWPEARFNSYFHEPRVAEAFRRSANRMQAALLFQAMERENHAHSRSEFNTAVLIDDEGRDQGHYRKTKRVAFGEYLPLLGVFPEARRWVRGELGDFFSHVSAGEGPARFPLKGMQVVPLICYEAMFPYFVADAARGGGPGELLVTVSNNAWFGPTQQPFQHLNASVLRAVENRTPLLHVMNNGPSAVVLPNGQRLFQSAYGEEAGYWVDIPVAASGVDSLFTRFPWLFRSVLYGALLATLFRAGWLVPARRATPTAPAS